MVDAAARATPKSSRTTPSTLPSRRSTLLGLRSRWVIPSACTAASASAIWWATSSASATGSGPSPRRASSVTPSSHSIASHRAPSSLVPWAMCWTMSGCCTASSRRASRRKRAASSGGATLSATARPVSWSVAR
ncbi:hypothetical protein BE20_26025 [Sorangium cellulosum]|nr:hypothetical protein BE20_26025 [Sorangium cellulosum]